MQDYNRSNKNILLLVNNYPSLDVSLINNTYVCHYFAKEWVKMGYNVHVIYNYNIYPRMYYWGINLLKKKISSLLYQTINDVRFTKESEYEIDGVKIIRLPILKYIPGKGFKNKYIKKQIFKIVAYNDREDFSPDFILGHFIHPSMELLYELKNEYNVPTSLVLHGEIPKLSKRTYNRYKKFLTNIDFIGFRSLPIKRVFEKLFGATRESFMCYSGIPEQLISTHDKHFSQTITKFVFVGNLRYQKHPMAVLKALKKIFNGQGFLLKYIGEGNERAKIEDYIEKYNLKNYVSLLGKIPREKVIEEFDWAECMIVISSPETFGLVYIEAMSHGCIVVASRNEGMEGIIKNGINGFLCDAGNSEKLAEIIKNINSLSLEEKKNISLNSIETAKKLTDYKVAKNYIDSIS